MSRAALRAVFGHEHRWSAPLDIQEQMYDHRPPTLMALRECKVCHAREWHLHPPATPAHKGIPNGPSRMYEDG